MSGSHSLEIVELSLKPRSAGVHVLSTTPDCLPRVPQGLHFSWKTIFQSSKGRQLEEQFHRGERVEPQSWLLSPGVLCPLVAVLLITIAGERGHCVFLTVPTKVGFPPFPGTAKTSGAIQTRLTQGLAGAGGVRCRGNHCFWL